MVTRPVRLLSRIVRMIFRLITSLAHRLLLHMKVRGTRKLSCLMVVIISVTLIVMLTGLGQVRPQPGPATHQDRHHMVSQLRQQLRNNPYRSGSLTPPHSPHASHPHPGQPWQALPLAPGDGGLYPQKPRDSRRSAALGLKDLKQRLFMARAVDFKEQSSTPGLPSLLAHGPPAQGPLAHGALAHGPLAHGPLAHRPPAHGPPAHGPLAQGPLAHGPLAQMRMDMWKRAGRWAVDSPHMLPHADGSQLRFQDPQRHRHPEGLQQVKEADKLWDLIQSETAGPPQRDTSQGASHCVPKHHIFFAKVHKTGSSTVANILQRYGFARGLNFVLPRKRIHSASYNYLSLPGQPVTRDRLIPPPVGQTYDILWNHAIYDRQFYRSIMPHDTFFLATLRQPLQQFQSAFEYYGNMAGSPLRDILLKNVSNPLSLYLQNSAFQDWTTPCMSYIRNKQSQDMGMTRQHVLNSTARQQYLHTLDKDFNFVIITELFDESLVLLRRQLCWEVKDIIYILKNKNHKKKTLEFSQEDVAIHKWLNAADYDLYNLFLKRLTVALSHQPADFSAEVSHFKELLKQVQAYCSVPSLKTPLAFNATQWSSKFTIKRSDCQLMQKHELFFLNDLMTDAVHRYHRSVLHV